MAPTDHSRRDVTIGEQRLEGELAGPADPHGLVIFAHGSGSSRHSPRNTFVAESLRRRGFATLLIDLLTEVEAGDRRNVFDIHLLAGRVVEALAWARGYAKAGALPDRSSHATVAWPGSCGRKPEIHIRVRKLNLPRSG